MDRLMVMGEGWAHGPVHRARSALDRLLGLRRRDVESVLIETRSVHGVGLREPFLAVGLGEDMRVRSVRVVRPGRIAQFRGCRYVLELPIDAAAPPAGARLEVRSYG